MTLKKRFYSSPSIQSRTIEIEQLLGGNSKVVKVENDIQEQWDNETIDSEFNWDN